jgi:hypothetical protein
MHPTVTERGTSVSPTLPTLPFRWAPCKVALAFESSVDLAAVDLLEAVVLYSGVDNLSNNGTTLHCMPRRRHSNGNQAGAQICYSADVCCVLLSKTLFTIFKVQVTCWAVDLVLCDSNLLGPKLKFTYPFYFHALHKKTIYGNELPGNHTINTEAPWKYGWLAPS